MIIIFNPNSPDSKVMLRNIMFISQIWNSYIPELSVIFLYSWTKKYYVRLTDQTSGSLSLVVLIQHSYLWSDSACVHVCVWKRDNGGFVHHFLDSLWYYLYDCPKGSISCRSKGRTQVGFRKSNLIILLVNIRTKIGFLHMIHKIWILWSICANTIVPSLNAQRHPQQRLPGKP